MCIASCVRVSDSKIVYTFTRDERVDRPFLDPHWIQTDVFAPIDSEAGGTWIGFNPSYILSIQNGGEQAHIRHLPYEKSRGVLLLDLLKTNNWEGFISSLNHNRIEPFTLNKIDIANQTLKVYTFNGSTVNEINVNELPFINFSSTLYDDKLKQQLSKKFRETKIAMEEDIWNFHLEHRIGTISNPLKRPSSSSLIQFVISEQVRCRYLNTLSGNEIKEIVLS